MSKINFYNKTEENINIVELKKLLKLVAKKEGLKDFEFSVIFINDQEIKELNKKYRNLDKETDVISFALEDNKFIVEPKTRILGDIYVSIEKAKLQAKTFKHSFEKEITFLVVHGFYHLLGYNHETESDEIIMITKQEEVLKSYGVKRTTQKKGL